MRQTKPNFNHFLGFIYIGTLHCNCDWTDTGAKQAFSQLIVELCRENMGKFNTGYLSSKSKDCLRHSSSETDH